MRRAALICVGLTLVASAAFSGDVNIHRNAHSIPNRYVVVLESSADTSAVVQTAHSLKSAQVRHTYARGLKAFAMEASEADAQALARDARVKYVEEDAKISFASTTSAPWGLDRVDQRFLPLNGSYVSIETGKGVTAYVVDTGIMSSQNELAGRVKGGFDAIGDGNGTEDCNGHGTHVSGIIGGTHYGVAPEIALVPVRVLDCTGAGSLSSVLAGLDWVLQDHAANATPAVVNMSLSGDPSSTLDNEVNSLLAAGITTVVAAGNNGADACNYSPAHVAGAITVGATDANDAMTSWSNFGPCVDVLAPGAGILSAWYTSPTATAISSGTSEAAPFVAGVAALYLQSYPTATPSNVAQSIIANSTTDVATNVGSTTANRLIFSQVGALNTTSTADSQLLSDPGFDYGTTFWASDICTVGNPAGCAPFEQDFYGASLPPRPGNTHKIAIGGPTKAGHVTSESVTLPAGIRRAELSFYLWIVTKDKSSAADDILSVQILDNKGKVLETLATYSNLDACPTYVARRFDATAYRGTPIHVGFSVQQKNGQPTWFALDQVELNIWR